MVTIELLRYNKEFSSQLLPDIMCTFLGPNGKVVSTMVMNKIDSMHFD